MLSICLSSPKKFYLVSSPLNFVGIYQQSLDFPGGSDGKESACNAGDPGSIPGLGGSPGEGNGCPLQCSGLENSRDYSMRSRRAGHG